METAESILTNMRAFLEKDDPEGAKSFIQQTETKEISDAAFHRNLAMICEDLGLIPRAIMEYNLSLRDGPKQAPVLKKLAVIYQDQGDVDKAIRAWQQVIPLAPEDEEPVYELGLLFEQNKEWESARNLYQDAYERTQNPKFQKFIKELQFQSKVAREEAGREASPEEALLSPTDAQLIHFTTLFSGRVNCR